MNRPNFPWRLCIDTDTSGELYFGDSGFEAGQRLYRGVFFDALEKNCSVVSLCYWKKGSAIQRRIHTICLDESH